MSTVLYKTVVLKCMIIRYKFMPRRSREELEQRRAEERARQQAEAQRLIEEKMRREEEEQRQAEEERAQAMKEAALLLKQVGNANTQEGNYIWKYRRPRGGFLLHLFLMDNHCFPCLFRERRNKPERGKKLSS